MNYFMVWKHLLPLSEINSAASIQIKFCQKNLHTFQAFQIRLQIGNQTEIFCLRFQPPRSPPPLGAHRRPGDCSATTASPKAQGAHITNENLRGRLQIADGGLEQGHASGG
jgi:hypothetical protein